MESVRIRRKHMAIYKSCTNTLICPIKNQLSFINMSTHHDMYNKLNRLNERRFNVGYESYK